MNWVFKDLDVPQHSHYFTVASMVGEKTRDSGSQQFIFISSWPFNIPPSPMLLYIVFLLVLHLFLLILLLNRKQSHCLSSLLVLLPPPLPAPLTWYFPKILFPGMPDKSLNSAMARERGGMGREGTYLGTVGGGLLPPSSYLFFRWWSSLRECLVVMGLVPSSVPSLLLLCCLLISLISSDVFLISLKYFYDW